MKIYDVNQLVCHIISNVDRKIAGTPVQPIVLDAYAVLIGPNGMEDEFYSTDGGFWTQFILDSYFDCPHLPMQEVDTDGIDVAFKARAVDLLGSVPLTYMEYYYHDGCNMCRYLIAVPTSQLNDIF